MISKIYMPKAMEPLQQHAENTERVQPKREWTEDPAIMEIATADDVNAIGSIP